MISRDHDDDDERATRRGNVLSVDSKQANKIRTELKPETEGEENEVTGTRSFFDVFLLL